MNHFDTQLPDGTHAKVYILRGGGLEAHILDYGATLVKLLVPDRQGVLADVVLGYDRAADYALNNSNLGATVGRNANRIGGAKFTLNGTQYTLSPNDHERNNLHSGPDIYNHRMWKAQQTTVDSITLLQNSPDGDQGYPGNARIEVTYTLKAPGILQIHYKGSCDKDTVFNMTNHSYFNLAGHNKPEKAMDQVLQLPSTHFTPADAQSIPTGELRSVEGTPMDFRIPKPIGRDIENNYDALLLQQGYDHNYSICQNPCATLWDPGSGRTMQVYTDCVGLQFYSGNYLDKIGKNGIHYTKRGGICLETQFFPDSVNHPEWKQPFFKAGQVYSSATEYRFSW